MSGPLNVSSRVRTWADQCAGRMRGVLPRRWAVDKQLSRVGTDWRFAGSGRSVPTGKERTTSVIALRAGGGDFDVLAALDDPAVEGVDFYSAAADDVL